MNPVETKYNTERDRILASIETPYEELLGNQEPDSQYYLDLIKLKIALSTNLISLEDVNTISQELHKDSEALAGVFIPLYEPWSQDMIDRVTESLSYLKKHHIVTSKKLNSAIYDMLGFNRPHQVPLATQAAVMKYFAMNPMNSFKDASLVLDLHRSTVYDAYKKLESHHWVRTLGHNNVSGFGLCPVFFIFELNHTESWKQIETCFKSYPFTSRFLQYPNSNSIVSAFLIPGSSANLLEFKDGMKEVSDEFFKYSSIHLYEGSGRCMNPALMQGGEWLLPDCIIQKNLDAENSYVPSIAATERNEFMKDLTYSDFLLEEILCMNPRMKPSEAQTHLKTKGHTLPLRTISHRKQLLIERGILTPFLWFARLGFHYDIPVEVVCDSKTRNRVLKVLSGFPLIYLYFKSDRGVIFWLETPHTHLEEYYWFLNSLKSMKGVKSVKSILATNYLGGRPNQDILAGYEYGEDGFLNTSTDVDITDYLG